MNQHTIDALVIGIAVGLLLAWAFAQHLTYRSDQPLDDDIVVEPGGPRDTPSRARAYAPADEMALVHCPSHGKFTTDVTHVMTAKCPTCTAISRAATDSMLERARTQARADFQKALR